MKEITELEMCEQLLLDNKTELMKCKLMDRLQQRMRLAGEKGADALITMNQSKIRTLELMLKHLKLIHTALLEDNKKIVDNKATIA